MAHTPHGDLPQSENSQQEGPVEVISAEGQSLVEVPGNGFISNADMSRDGNDLVLESPDGATVVVEGYFLADPAPAIESPDGGVLTPSLLILLFAPPHNSQPIPPRRMKARLEPLKKLKARRPSHTQTEQATLLRSARRFIREILSKPAAKAPSTLSL